MIEHPTDPDVVVLRLEEGGGFVPWGFFATQRPAFSLFGDGTVVYAPAPRLDPSAAGPEPLLVAAMDEAQVSALLAYALGEGGLAEARAFYDQPGIADAGTSVFTVRAGGFDKTVSVYALGFEVPGGPDPAIRARLGALGDLLRDFAVQVAAGRAADAGPYDPPAYRAVLLDAVGAPDVVLPWPWNDLAPEDFVPAENGARAVLTPDQARLLHPEPDGGLFPIALDGPDGALYTVALRPLLPDESE
jgi:hypothetical protein